MARSLRDSAIRSRIAAHHEDILSRVQPAVSVLNPIPTVRKVTKNPNEEVSAAYQMNSRAYWGI